MIHTMSSINVESTYTAERFPIMQVFEEQTEIIRNNGAGAVEGLVRVYDELHDRGLAHSIDLGSTAITTSGHAHVPGNDMKRVIEGNTRTARLVSCVLEQKGDIEGKNFALTADMGDTGWNQLYWNQFWPLFAAVTNPKELIGHDARAYGQFEDRIARQIHRHGVDTDLMIDASVTNERRAPEYDKLAEALIDSIVESPGSPRPVARIVQLIGKDQSLGMRIEGRIGEYFGVPRLTLAAVRPASIQEVAEAFEGTVPQLSEDIKVLTANGAEIVVARARSGLTLIRS